MIFSEMVGAMITAELGFRADGNPNLYERFPEEFGCASRPFSFYSGKNKLYGEVISYGEKPPKAIVVFFHGLGGGRTSYTQEICAIAKAGYSVYCFDATGSMTSEGEVVGNLSQVLLDQKHFFEFLDKENTSLPRFACGHSWGGYAALCSLQPEYHIAKVCSIAGFVSSNEMIYHAAPIAKKVGWLLKRYQKRHFGKYGNLDSRDLIKHSDAKVLYIQGDRDEMVPLSVGYEALFPLRGEKLELMLVKDRGHQPYWSIASQKYYESLKEKKFLGIHRDINYVINDDLLNQDDPAVIKRIIDFFDN